MQVRRFFASREIVYTVRMTTHSVLLTNRALLRLSGRDARSWLQALVTNDVENLAAGQGRYAALHR